jgi:hypothetical protein
MDEASAEPAVVYIIPEQALKADLAPIIESVLAIRQVTPGG